jgi:hypothetical protein
MGAQFSHRLAEYDKDAMARIRVGSRLAALLIGVALVSALWTYKPQTTWREPPAISSIRLAPLEPDAPQNTQQDLPAAPKLSPAAPKQPTQPQAQPTQTGVQAPLVDRAPVPRIDRTQSPTGDPTFSPPANVSAPRIATAPTQIDPGGGSLSPSSGTTQGGTSQRLGNNALAIVRARECARLDPRDRPADCPPNAELARLLAAERGPKYRPENAEAFSRSETAWRGVPPPCLEDGENAALKGSRLCIRVGTPPSRVRSPREICLARGLGGCEPPPSQAAVDAAVKQVRANESARQN